MIPLLVFVTWLIGFPLSARFFAYGWKAQGKSVEYDKGLIFTLSMLWPTTVPAVATAWGLLRLFELAIKDVGISKAERKEIRIRKRERDIQALEDELDMSPKKPEPVWRKVHPVDWYSGEPYAHRYRVREFVPGTDDEIEITSLHSWRGEIF